MGSLTTEPQRERPQWILIIIEFDLTPLSSHPFPPPHSTLAPPNFSCGKKTLGAVESPRNSQIFESMRPPGRLAGPPAEAGHGASGAGSVAGTGCVGDISLDSWKNILKVPLAGPRQDLP